MRLARLALEVKSINELGSSLLGKIILRKSLGKNLYIVCYADDRMLATELSVDLVLVDFVDADGSSFRFVVNSSFRNEGRDQVINDAVLGNESVIKVLQICELRTGHRQTYTYDFGYSFT